jgi:hypothetical protein
MPWRGPEHHDDFPSLGWQLLDWFECLPSPRDPSESLRFTDEQALQLVEWFAIDPLRGELIHRRGFSRRSKGWGKSPVEAAKVIAELAGPVKFDGWDANGEPVGRPWGGPGDPQPWVQVGAVSEDQTDNTWSVVYYFLTENDGAAADELGIDPGLTRCFLRNRPGAKLEPVTASAGSREGQPITYACLDETHLWTPTNGGVKLARTLRRNVAKMGGRSYETTNSFVRGTRSVAEASHRAAMNGAAGVYADEIEAPTEINGEPVTLESTDADLSEALRIAYGGSWWVDTARLIADIRDPDADWEESCMFFLNWNRDKAPESTADPRSINLTTWDRLAVAPDIATYDKSTARLAVAVAHDRSWTTIAIAGTNTQGFAQLRLVANLPGTDGVAARVDELRKELAEEGNDSPVAVVKGDPIADDLVALGIEVDEVGPGDKAKATQKLIDATKLDAPTVRHQGEPALRKSIELAILKTYGRTGVTWAVRPDEGEISPLDAVTMAFGRLMTVEPEDEFFIY